MAEAVAVALVLPQGPSAPIRFPPDATRFCSQRSSFSWSASVDHADHDAVAVTDSSEVGAREAARLHVHDEERVVGVAHGGERRAEHARVVRDQVGRELGVGELGERLEEEEQCALKDDRTARGNRASKVQREAAGRGEGAAQHALVKMLLAHRHAWRVQWAAPPSWRRR